MFNININSIIISISAIIILISCILIKTAFTEQNNFHKNILEVSSNISDNQVLISKKMEKKYNEILIKNKLSKQDKILISQFNNSLEKEITNLTKKIANNTLKLERVDDLWWNTIYNQSGLGILTTLLLQLVKLQN